MPVKFVTSVVSLLLIASGWLWAQSSALSLKDAKLIAEGERLFAQKCSISYCHGKEGTTGPAPALRDRKWVVSDLRKTILKGVPNSSMPNWDDKLSEDQIWAVVGYVLLISGDPAAKQASGQSSNPSRSPSAESVISGSSVPESLNGNPARGEELFFASSGGKGNSVGPDLAGSASKTAKDLFREIIFPQASANSENRPLLITLKDREKLFGLKQEETATGLRVFDLAGNPPVLRRLAKEEIQAIEPQAKSAMSGRYGEIYTLRELLDLVSFLKSGRVTFTDIQ